VWEGVVAWGIGENRPTEKVCVGALILTMGGASKLSQWRKGGVGVVEVDGDAKAVVSLLGC
jgi:hypothetical protein